MVGLPVGGFRMRGVGLADLGPTIDPADSVSYGPGYGVVELTRMARIYEKWLAELQEENARLRAALLSTPFGKEAAILLKRGGQAAISEYTATMRAAGEFDAAEAWEKVCNALSTPPAQEEAQ